MKVTILTDNQKSWFVPYGHKLKILLEELAHDVQYVFSSNDIPEGDICFILSCTRLIKPEILSRNNNNIVVHASDLPEGKGFSPLQWQILEGKNRVCLTLFEVVDEVDAGPYYLKEYVNFDGTELYEELRHKLAEGIVMMCKQYTVDWKTLKGTVQEGIESFYSRRTKQEDKLDVNKTLAEQFDHFRIADNENYPLWFEIRGKRYLLKIYSI